MSLLIFQATATSMLASTCPARAVALATTTRVAAGTGITTMATTMGTRETSTSRRHRRNRGQVRDFFNKKKISCDKTQDYQIVPMETFLNQSAALSQENNCSILTTLHGFNHLKLASAFFCN